MLCVPWSCLVAINTSGVSGPASVGNHAPWEPWREYPEGRYWGAEARMPRRLHARLLAVDVVYTESLIDLPSATWAAASRAIGTR
jgi:hypothetical protein